MNIAASPCTLPMGLAGSNQRGPGVPWIRSRCRAPSGPATRRNNAWPSRLRTVPITLPRIRRHRPVAQSSLGISTHSTM